jgi:hypothetical protein
VILLPLARLTPLLNVAELVNVTEYEVVVFAAVWFTWLQNIPWYPLELPSVDRPTVRVLVSLVSTWENVSPWPATTLRLDWVFQSVPFSFSFKRSVTRCKLWVRRKFMGTAVNGCHCRMQGDRG